MLAVAFDTLKLAKKLEGSGMPQKQAEGVAISLSESLTEWHSVGNLATKDDIHQLRTDLAETKAEILKWLFAAIGTQTIVLLAALYGIIHSK